MIVQSVSLKKIVTCRCGAKVGLLRTRHNKKVTVDIMHQEGKLVTIMKNNSYVTHICPEDRYAT